MNRYWSVIFVALLLMFIDQSCAMRRIVNYVRLQDEIITDYYGMLQECNNKKERATDVLESCGRCSFMKIRPEACGVTLEKVNQVLKENRDEN